MSQKTYEYFSDMSFDEYWQTIKDAAVKNIESMLEKDDGSDCINSDILKNVEMMKPAVKEQFASMKKLTPDDYVNQYKNMLNATKSCQGASAEVNRSLFIKNHTGDMRKTNYAETFFCDLKNEYALTESVDKELPKPTKIIELDKYGLIHNDIEMNEANTVHGRVVDYGSFTTQAHTEKLIQEMQEEIKKYFDEYDSKIHEDEEQTEECS